jgi:hypothetical protein
MVLPSVFGCTVIFGCKICWVGDAIKSDVRGVEGSNVPCLRNDE